MHEFHLINDDFAQDSHFSGGLSSPIFAKAHCFYNCNKIRITNYNKVSITN